MFLLLYSVVLLSLGFYLFPFCDNSHILLIVEVTSQEAVAVYWQ